MSILLADPPNWTDNPGAYEFTATISGGIVLNEGEQMGDDGDMFAAFDADGNVRGLGLMLFPPFGPYQGTPVFEVQLRSNAANISPSSPIWSPLSSSTIPPEMVAVNS